MTFVLKVVLFAVIFCCGLTYVRSHMALDQTEVQPDDEFESNRIEYYFYSLFLLCRQYFQY